MRCEGYHTGEMCGGYDRMSIYKIATYYESSYIGCYGDSKSRRAMPDTGRHTKPGRMTNEVSFASAGMKELCVSCCAAKAQCDLCSSLGNVTRV